jgi:hypothetical protein
MQNICDNCGPAEEVSPVNEHYSFCKKCKIEFDKKQLKQIFSRLNKEQKIEKIIATLEFDEDGNINCLWTEDINLYELGKVCDVRRASRLEFSEKDQAWAVINAATDEIIHMEKSRAKAIEWEIDNFSPEGKYYHG